MAKNKRIFHRTQLRLRLSEPYYDMAGHSRSWSLYDDQNENGDFYLSYSDTFTKECSVSVQVGQDVLDKAAQLKALPFKVKPIRGSDGWSQEIEFRAGFQNCMFHWWCDHVPDGWTDLVTYYYETQKRFTDLLNQAPGPKIKIIKPVNIDNLRPSVTHEKCP